MDYWTDYPIIELGDEAGRKAPIRKCLPVSYDRNKYCEVIVEGVNTSFKSGYIYKKPGRCGDVPSITNGELHELPNYVDDYSAGAAQ